MADSSFNLHSLLPQRGLLEGFRKAASDPAAFKSVTPGRMVAGLQFGFWTGFFNKSHGRTGLGHALASRAFPHAPRWKEGTIGDVPGVAEKGEEIIQALEQELPKLSAAGLRGKYPAVADFLDWLAN